MSKVLVVSSSLFPKRSGSAIVMENLLCHFTCDEAAVVGELPPLGRRLRRKQNTPERHYFRSRFTMFGRGARFFTPLRWRLLPLLVNRLCKIARQQGCDSILGVYPEEMYCLASCLAAERLDLPFYPYFHNTYADNQAIRSKRKHERQERILRQAQCVFVMSEGMREHFVDSIGDAHPGKEIVSLVHTFNEYPSEAGEYHLRTDRTRVALYGNFNESNLDATRRFCQAALGVSNVELTMHTDVPTILLRQRGLPMDRIRKKAPLGDLSMQELMNRLRDYDVLALTHGFEGGLGDVEYRTIFPTRTIPMLLAGRPLFVHSPPQSFLTEFAIKNRIGCVSTTTATNRVQTQFEEFITSGAAIQESIRSARKAGDQFFGPDVATKLKKRVVGASVT